MCGAIATTAAHSSAGCGSTSAGPSKRSVHPSHRLCRVSRSARSSSSGSSCFLLPLACEASAGWSRTPNHNTPETLQLTAPTPRPMLGTSGLLQLLTWVEHRRGVQTSEHEEGGIPCPIPHPTRLPPALLQANQQSVGGPTPGQSEASPLAAESPARTPDGTQQHTRHARVQRSASQMGGGEHPLTIPLRHFG